jgi:putative transcriptional regulator
MFTINLKKLLENKEWNISDLWRATGGKKSGVRYNTLLAYYHGYIKRPRINDLIKICDALECKLSDLIEYIPDKTNHPLSSK